MIGLTNFKSENFTLINNYQNVQYISFDMECLINMQISYLISYFVRIMII